MIRRLIAVIFMHRSNIALLLLCLLSVAAAAQAPTSAAWVDKSPHKEGIIAANGIRLHYLNWGGSGETMLFLTGLGVTPHIFDDLATPFTARFRVLGLTRRGLGKSDKPATGYDTGTLTEDLRGFLDALQIKRVTLVGWSLAGTEMTRFATLYPARVNHLIYLDSAYDYAGWPEIWAQDPVANAPTKEDLVSFEASRRWFTKVFGFWSDAVEADARAINLQPDGTVKLEAMSEAITKQLLDGMTSAHPDFTKIKAPVLAFYAVSQNHPGILPSTGAMVARKAQAYWREVFLPKQREQIARLRSELPAARIVELPDAQHLCFIRRQDEDRIKREMLSFLAAKQQPSNRKSLQK